MLPRLQRFSQKIQPGLEQSRFMIPAQSFNFHLSSLSLFNSYHTSAANPLHNLPVMNALNKHAKNIYGNKPFANTAIVYIHHPLQTSVNVVDSLLALGANPKYFFALGKHYSECIDVVSKIKKYNVQYQDCSAQIGLGKFAQSFARDINRLWSKVEEHCYNLGKKNSEIKNIIVMDHGGHALTYVPASIVQDFNVVGIEKTTGGLVHIKEAGIPPFPVINMATCATKIFLESPLIADAVVSKLQPLMPAIQDSNKTCAVIGYGNIGKAVAKKLLSLGHKVIAYDITFKDSAKLEAAKLEAAKQPHKPVMTGDLSSVMSNANYIFGCTGHDISSSFDYRIINQDKTLISCSSEDKEFLTLIKEIQKEKNGKVATKPLVTLDYKSEFGATITIIRGGFPVNFDNTGESVPAQDIQLTRALTLGSALQALRFFAQGNLFEQNGAIYSLDPEIQQLIAREWLKLQPKGRVSDSLIDLFNNNTEWIKENSNGIYRPSNIFTKKSEANMSKPKLTQTQMRL